MRKALISLAAIAACGGAAVAADRAQDREAAERAAFDKAVAGLTPGKPMSCLPLSRQSLSTQAIGSKLLYRASRKLVYVSETTGGCEGVARGDTLVTRQYNSRACSGDFAQTVDRIAHFPTGSCALGEFTPYRAN